MLEQLQQRSLGIEEAAAVFGVIRREQDLRGADPVPGECALPRLNQLHLTGGCRRLQFIEARPPSIDVEDMTADGDGARGYDQQLVANATETGDLAGEPLDRPAIEAAAAVDQQRGTQFDDESL